MEESTPNSPSFNWDTLILLNVTLKRNSEELDSSSVFMSPTITPTSVEKTPAANRAGTSQQGDRFDEMGQTPQFRTPAGADVDMEASSSGEPEVDKRMKPNSRKRGNDDKNADVAPKHICEMNMDEIGKLEREETERRLSMAPRKRNCTVWVNAPPAKISRGPAFSCADCPRCLMAFQRVKSTDARPVQRRLEF